MTHMILKQGGATNINGVNHADQPVKFSQCWFRILHHKSHAGSEIGAQPILCARCSQWTSWYCFHLTNQTICKVTLVLEFTLQHVVVSFAHCQLLLQCCRPPMFLTLEMWASPNFNFKDCSLLLGMHHNCWRVYITTKHGTPGGHGPYNSSATWYCWHDMTTSTFDCWQHIIPFHCFTLLEWLSVVSCCIANLFCLQHCMTQLV